MIEHFQQFMIESGATWVLWLLLLLSVASLSIMVDRARAFWSRRDDLARLARDLHVLLEDGQIEGARRRLEASPSTAAAVVLAGLDRWGKGASAAEEAMAAATGVERARLERRLLFLGTVGSNAPFVGLLGTVIGNRSGHARASSATLRVRFVR